MSPNRDEETTSGGPAPVPEGRATLGPYRIVQLLGRGAMGIVYEGEGPDGQRVALKVLPNWVAGEGESLKRFLREAQAASRVKHPNVVAIHEASQDGEVWFLALELVPGGSLHDRVRLSGPLPWREATRALAQACRGLAAVHEAGIVHRDIKPGNLLLAADGTAKVADFGLARMSSAQFSPLTVEGTTLGTPAYMSPEQCKLQKPDEFSDIYSMGATYYALLTGGPPYEGDTAMQVMFAHCSLDPPDPRARVPGLPEGCTAVIRKAMARRPTDRYPSANAMADALDELGKLVHEDTLTNFPTLRVGPVPTRRRWLATAAAAAGGALVAGGAVGLAWYLSRPGPQPEPKTLSFLDRLVRDGEMKLDSPTYGFTFLLPRWLAVSMNGAGGKGGVQLWDLTTGKLHQHLWPKTGILSVALSPDGRRLAAAGNDGTGNLLRDLTSGEDIPLISPDTRPAYSLGFVGLDRLVGGLVPLPKQKAGLRVWEIDMKVSWAGEPVHADEVFATVSPNGQWAATTSKADRFFCVWSLSTRDRVTTVPLPTQGTALAWSPDGSTLAVVATSTVLFYKAPGWEKVGPTIDHPGAQFWRAAFAPDGRRIVTVGVAARIWDTQTGKLIKQLHPDDWIDHRLALTSDGRVLATGGVERPRLRFFSVAEWCAGGG